MSKTIKLFETKTHYLVKVNEQVDCRYPKTEENLRNAKAYCFDLYGVMRMLGDTTLDPYINKES